MATRNNHQQQVSKVHLNHVSIKFLERQITWAQNGNWWDCLVADKYALYERKDEDRIIYYELDFKRVFLELFRKFWWDHNA